MFVVKKKKDFPPVSRKGSRSKTVPERGSGKISGKTLVIPETTNTKRKNNYIKNPAFKTKIETQGDRKQGLRKILQEARS